MGETMEIEDEPQDFTPKELAKYLKEHPDESLELCPKGVIKCDGPQSN